MLYLTKNDPQMEEMFAAKIQVLRMCNKATHFHLWLSREWEIMSEGFSELCNGLVCVVATQYQG